jgi:SAM-dependent methyltransferase
MTEIGEDLYALQAGVYDLVHASTKNHGKELAVLGKRIRGAIGRDPQSWLDVGCGTGHHLEALHARGIEILAGIDNSATQIAGAEQRLLSSEVQLELADMCDFSIPTPEGGFDVVASLFSCVGHLHHDEQYLHALQRMAAHVNPKGVVIVEPWIATEDYRPGRVDVDQVTGDGMQVVRITKHLQDKDLAILEFRFVVSRSDTSLIGDWTSTFQLKLRSLDEQRALFDQVFQSVEFQPTGSGSRGLFLARKPRSLAR